MPTIAPPASYSNATPNIFVEIYPPRVGTKSYVFSNTFGTSNGVLAATVTKNIRDGSGGKFVIQIPPGGPAGVNDPFSWTRVLVPMSFVVIALARATSNRIVMVGVITDIQESQIWGEDGRVTRTIAIQGLDFAYYFTAFSYYQMTYLGILAASVSIGLSGLILTTMNKRYYGPVPSMGQQYLTEVMLGTGAASTSSTPQGVLSNTFINYKRDAHFLRDIYGYVIESLAASDQPQPEFFPVGLDFYNSEGAWLDKFLQIFRWPYYEFYVITANNTDYPTLGTLPNSDQGGFSHSPSYTFSIPGFNSVSPIIVARINPLPWAGITPPSTKVYTSTKWNNLPLYNYEKWGFIRSDVSYSVGEHCNIFMVNPTESSMIQQNAGGPIQYYSSELIGVTYSPYSIAKYGYKMASMDIKWLTYFLEGDPNYSKNSLAGFSTVLLGMLSSYYLPVPSMLSGAVIIPMWPDIMPGCKFTYRPFKSTDIYEFYIEGVIHNYIFGGQSNTTLNLSRGLLKTDYANTTTMTGLLTDTYTMQDGTLQSRPTGAPYEGLKFSQPGDSNISNYQNLTGNPVTP